MKGGDSDNECLFLSYLSIVRAVLARSDAVEDPMNTVWSAAHPLIA